MATFLKIGHEMANLATLDTGMYAWVQAQQVSMWRDKLTL